MGYTKRRLEPVNGNRGRGVWIVVFIGLIASIVTVFMFQRMKVDLLEKDDFCDSSDRILDFGDYSDLQRSDFCRRHGIDATKVRKKYDLSRHADIYIGTYKDQKQQMPGAWIQKISSWTECSNQIVEMEISAVMTTEGERGSAEYNRGCRSVAGVLYDEVDAISAFSCDGNRIVASSLNVKYRGYSKNATLEALMEAIGDVLEYEGWVAIEWETPKFFIEWQVLSCKGVYVVQKRKSNRLIRNKVLRNEY